MLALSLIINILINIFFCINVITINHIFHDCVFLILEDDGVIKTDGDGNKNKHNSPTKGRTKSGSQSTDQAVDQLQASEKLIAGMVSCFILNIQFCGWYFRLRF